jgi:hypothetical protein
MAQQPRACTHTHKHETGLSVPVHAPCEKAACPSALGANALNQKYGDVSQRQAAAWKQMYGTVPGADGDGRVVPGIALPNGRPSFSSLPLVVG